MSYDPNLPGGGPEVTPLRLFGLNPNRTPEQVAAAKAIADSEAEEARKRVEVRMAADAASRTAEQHAAEEAAKADAFAHGHSAYQSPVTGEAAFLEPNYRPASSAEVVQRVLPTPDTGAAGRIAGYQPPAQRTATNASEPDPIGAFQGQLGNMVSYAKNLGREKADSGVIRWSMGGKWYERKPGSSVDMPVEQSKGPDGRTTFKVISGAPDDMDTIHSIARGSRDADLVGPPTEDQQYGAFGKALPAAVSGGFSPSPALSDVATLPQSSIDDIMQRAQYAKAKTAIAGEQPIGAQAGSEKTGIPQVDMLSRIFEQNPQMTRNQRIQLTIDAISHGAGKSDELSMKEASAQKAIAYGNNVNAQVAKIDAQLNNPKLDPALRESLNRDRQTLLDNKEVYTKSLVEHYSPDKFTTLLNTAPTGK
jgi:hypothetical protein